MVRPACAAAPTTRRRPFRMARWSRRSAAWPMPPASAGPPRNHWPRRRGSCRSCGSGSPGSLRRTPRRALPRRGARSRRWRRCCSRWRASVPSWWCSTMRTGVTPTAAASSGSSRVASRTLRCCGCLRSRRASWSAMRLPPGSVACCEPRPTQRRSRSIRCRRTSSASCFGRWVTSARPPGRAVSPIGCTA